ncbi:MAG: tryptophan synthase subunit alpha [Pseudomonadota bacterium]
MSGAESISRAIRAANDAGRPALVAFLTAGYPDRDQFIDHLRQVASAADVVEIGVPFTDPMADGVTIQRASQGALEAGVSLRWILDELKANDTGDTPLLLMGYLNPMLSLGYETLAKDSAESGVSGFIVPDLPYEESAPMRTALEAYGLGLVQLVTPVTPEPRLKTLCEASGGFVYAVTVTGITGGAKDGGDGGANEGIAGYLKRVRDASPLPVCAGFGIRTREQVAELAPHAEGLVVGSALVEVLERGEDPAGFLNGLRS